MCGFSPTRLERHEDREGAAVAKERGEMQQVTVCGRMICAHAFWSECHWQGIA